MIKLYENKSDDGIAVRQGKSLRGCVLQKKSVGQNVL